MIVGITSLDRKCPKVNHPLALLEKTELFRCFRGALAIVLHERALIFVRGSVKSNDEFIKQQKSGCPSAKYGYLALKILKSYFWGQIPIFSPENSFIGDDDPEKII